MLTIIIFYGSIIFCAIALMVRLFSFLRAPIHLRWEIYRENPTYNLSQSSMETIGENRKLKDIALDIFFLRRYYRQKAQFWITLYPFHLGIFLLIVWHIWIFTSALTGIHANTDYTLIFGHTATALAFAGGFGILMQRIFDKRMRLYYSPIHYVKWLLMLALLAQGFLTVYMHFGNSIPEVIRYVERQLAFDWVYKLNSPLATSLHVLMASVFILYLPFGHLSRLFFRYYHELRWDFVPKIRSRAIQRNISRNLARPMTWSASHIGSARNWTEAIAGSTSYHSGDSIS